MTGALEESRDTSEKFSPKAEWEKSRATIEKFDDILVDLRKYGFTLITGILTASSFLGFSDTAAVAQVAVIIVTMVLVLVLYWLDTVYQSMLFGAVFRARYLEIFKLGWGLSNYISTFLASARICRLIPILYAGFLFSAFILGLFVSTTAVYLAIPTSVSSVVSQLSTAAQHLSSSSPIVKNISSLVQQLSKQQSLTSRLGTSPFLPLFVNLWPYYVLTAAFGAAMSVFVLIWRRVERHRAKFVQEVNRKFRAHRDDDDTKDLDKELKELFDTEPWPSNY
jgi:hypothetical protein